MNRGRGLFTILFSCSLLIFADQSYAWHEDYFTPQEIQKIKSGQNIGFSAWFIGVFKEEQEGAVITMAQELLAGDINYALFHRLSTSEDKQRALAVLTYAGKLYALMGEDEEAQEKFLSIAREMSWSMARDFFKCLSNNVEKLFAPEFSDEKKTAITLAFLRTNKQVEPVLEIDEITPYCNQLSERIQRMSEAPELSEDEQRDELLRLIVEL